LASYVKVSAPEYPAIGVSLRSPFLRAALAEPSALLEFTRRTRLRWS